MNIQLGKRMILYNVVYSAKPLFRITITPDGSVSVQVPEGKSQEEIERRIRKKRRWIIRQLDYFDQFRPEFPKKSYVSGETHLYIGRQYRLKIVSEPSIPDGVKMNGRFLFIYTSQSNDRRHLQKQLDRWYRKRAEKLFEDRLKILFEKIKRYHCRFPDLVLRKMKRRWGSCTKTGKIILNTDLIKVPLNCIEYVIMHELCHLVEHNHTERFYSLLSTCMPDWEKRRKKLKQIRFEE
jgi:predicted metal-dependent hydrolase